MMNGDMVSPSFLHKTYISYHSVIEFVTEDYNSQTTTSLPPQSDLILYTNTKILYTSNCHLDEYIRNHCLITFPQQISYSIHETSTLIRWKSNFLLMYVIRQVNELYFIFADRTKLLFT